MKISSFKLGNGKVIDRDSPTFIIAEIGQNHQGDISIAKTLIKKAKESQADCVKFQKSSLKDKFTEEALNSAYSSPYSWGDTYGEHKEYLEFSEAEYLDLQQHAESLGILFSASAMDSNSLRFLDSINVPFIKIGSGDSTNSLLLEEAAKTGKPLIVSTGMCSMEDVETIYDIISKEHTNFALLQCVSSYPTRPEDANLGVINKYKSKFPVQIGYSGHEKGFNITLAAVALGAKIVERHITLNKSWKGSDHACSLDIDEFKQMVEAIREIEQGLGIEKRLLPCEVACWKKLGKSIVAARDINVGTIITKDCLTIKVSKPQGMPGKLINDVIGKTALKKILCDEPIEDGDFS